MSSVPTVQFVKTFDHAVVPSKGTPDSVGYDLTAINFVRKLNSNTYLYDTGIQVKPPKGYYVEILPRSSMSKTGHVLTNSTGIIDPDYRGNLMIALTKVNSHCEDLRLPFTRCQMILRRYVDFHLEEVPVLDLDTVRGTGGFGSTDK